VTYVTSFFGYAVKVVKFSSVKVSYRNTSQHHHYKPFPNSKNERELTVVIVLITRSVTIVLVTAVGAAVMRQVQIELISLGGRVASSLGVKEEEVALLLWFLVGHTGCMIVSSHFSSNPASNQIKTHILILPTIPIKE
jgi:hypothetical protein